MQYWLLLVLLKEGRGLQSFQLGLCAVRARGSHQLLLNSQ